MAIDWLNPSEDIIEAKRVGYQNGLAEMESAIDEKDSEIEHLQAIVDKLPKTADGVPIVPGMTVSVLANYGDGLRIHKLVVYDLTSIGCSDGDRYHWDCHQCYSTREAAEAALDAKKHAPDSQE